MVMEPVIVSLAILSLAVPDRERRLLGMLWRLEEPLTEHFRSRAELCGAQRSSAELSGVGSAVQAKCERQRSQNWGAARCGAMEKRAVGQ